VHSFDPTRRLLKKHLDTKPENVTFHYAGLRGEQFDHFNAKRNGLVFNESAFNTLPGWMRQLNHTYLDVFKVDCEGCEVQALAALSNMTTTMGFSLRENVKFVVIVGIFFQCKH